MQSRHQPEVEVGKIDQHSHLRLPLLRREYEIGEGTQRTRDDAQGFGEAGDGETVKIGNQLAAGGGESITAKSEDLDRRFTPAQRLDERAGIQVARRLAARQQNARH